MLGHVIELSTPLVVLEYLISHSEFLLLDDRLGKVCFLHLNDTVKNCKNKGKVRCGRFIDREYAFCTNYPRCIYSYRVL